MSTSLAVVESQIGEPVSGVPAVPWRDPQTVSRTELSAYINELERRCSDEPHRPDLWTCLGMAYAVNYEVEKSRDALIEATEVEPAYFWGRLKLGELHYRLRALDVAERETLRAVDLAENRLQLAIARTQLKDIRALNPQRVKHDVPASAWGRALFLSALLVVAVAVVMWS